MGVFTPASLGRRVRDAQSHPPALTLSHQYIDQLSLPIRQAVFGNVGSLISFRVGNSDAELLAGEFGHEFNQASFTELPKFQAPTRLYTNGQTQQPHRTRMMGPLRLHWWEAGKAQGS